MIDIILVDDHPLMRKGLACTIKSESDLQVVGEMNRAENALEQIDELRPNLALVDVSLPGMSGLELLK
jgi:two component transcriptional regulator, LuxR family